MNSRGKEAQMSYENRLKPHYVTHRGGKDAISADLWPWENTFGSAVMHLEIAASRRPRKSCYCPLLVRFELVSRNVYGNTICLFMRARRTRTRMYVIFPYVWALITRVNTYTHYGDMYRTWQVEKSDSHGPDWDV